jgi:hypothetical protein
LHKAYIGLFVKVNQVIQIGQKNGEILLSTWNFFILYYLILLDTWNLFLFDLIYEKHVSGTCNLLQVYEIEKQKKIYAYKGKGAERMVKK